MEKSNEFKAFEKKLKARWKKVEARLKIMGAALERGIYPEGLVCLDCSTELKSVGERYLSVCDACSDHLPFRQARSCEICGAYIMEEDGKTCENCKTQVPSYDKILAPFDYTGVIKKILVNYKKNGQTFLYLYIARYMTDFFKATDARAHLVTYVPSTKRRNARRGFDHLKKITAHFSAEVGMPEINPLFRTRDTVAQKKLGRGERFENVEGVFSLRPEFDPDTIKDQVVLLIDDVITTGATVNECAKVLKENGAKKVIVLALARNN